MSLALLGISAILLPFLGADALEAFLPQATMPGLIATVGMSPRPTHPPEVPPGIPKELAKRRTSIAYPAPGNWCGLVDNDINNVLSCIDTYAYCMYYGTAVGCCSSADLNLCTAMPTSCIDYGSPCDYSCQLNLLITSCTASTQAYCGTYQFESGSRLLGCFSTPDLSSTVVMLKEYFFSELGPDYTTIRISETPSTAVISATGSDNGVNQQKTVTSVTSPGASTTTTSSRGAGSSPASIKPSEKSDGLSGGAIAGIVVGVVAVVAAFAAFLIWVFFVKRRKKNDEGPQQPPQDPAMMQQPSLYGQQPPAGGYMAPDGTAAFNHQNQGPPRYSSAVYEPKPVAPSEPEVSEISGSPLQQQSQPLLGVGSGGEYYKPNNGSSLPPSEVDSTSPVNRVHSPGTTVSSVSATYPSSGYQLGSQAGPIPENIYEIGSCR